MIDFRYHVVSLVSVFLALAVGIVLGAGPLKESIGDTLSGQVAQLREDRDRLRADLQRADSSVEHRDTYLAALTPALVSNRLGGRSVLLVTVPGSDGDTVSAVREALETAGASVAGQLRLTDRWVQPSDAGRRASARSQLATVPAGAPVASAGSSASRPGPSATILAKDATVTSELARSLAAAVLTPQLAEARPLSEDERAVLDTLEDDGLVADARAVGARATEAVLVAPPVTPGEDTARMTGARPVHEAPPVWADVAGAMDRACGGALVAGPASSAESGGVVRAVRQSDVIAAGVSTVDTAGTGMGPISVVLALAEQLQARTGHYGFGPGAVRPLPALDPTEGR